MKLSPEDARLDNMLRSSGLSAGGFMGQDSRTAAEVIDSDLSELASLGVTVEELADKMTAIMRAAEAGLGTTVQISEHLEARTTEARGIIACPWPHPGRHPKTAVRVTRTDTRDALKWSALNVHMIEAHGFFEGRGSAFRLEPGKLVGMLFGGDRDAGGVT